jgi:multicomponent Na+:H+ antiporter subunit C
MNSEQILGLYNYWVVICLMMTGFYIVIARKNMIKTIIGLNIFQTSVILLYITMQKIDGATAPVIPPGESGGHVHATGPTVEHAGEAVAAAGQATEQAAALIYSNPLPSVLMLTAIVVGIATTALALALIVRIREEYGTIEEDEILLLDRNA